MKRFLVVCCGMWVAGCASPGKPTEQQLAEHQKDVGAWYDARVAELKGHDGWLNLAGLFWLKEGMNSFGSDENNDVVFPPGKIAAKAGYFMVKGNHVKLIPSKDVDLKEGDVFVPDSIENVLIKHGSLEWFIIQRADKMGIRLRDLESDAVKNFKGIDRYPVDYSWKVAAKFEPAAPGEKIDITNVLGQTFPTDLAGRYVFELNGKEYRLEATGTGDELFICFGDATNAKETYGAGRFIYVPRPDPNGNVFIDFNKSYNPPCAFTEFATCPIPRKENILPIEILAGEKNYYYHGKQASSNL